MIDFAKLDWNHPPVPLLGFNQLVSPWANLATVPVRNAPYTTYTVRFVASDYRPPESCAFAVVTDPVVVKYYRRRFRRELRKIVKTYGNVPRSIKRSPWWWTPRTPKLVVVEVV